MDASISTMTTSPSPRRSGRSSTTSIVPNYLEWEKAGITPRRGLPGGREERLLGMAVPEEFGAAGRRLPVQPDPGRADRRGRHHRLGPLDLAAQRHLLPYFLSFANDEQKNGGCPGIASGELITAVAMTEPGAAPTSPDADDARSARGDHYVVNGAKTFITNGINGPGDHRGQTGSDPTTAVVACR